MGIILGIDYGLKRCGLAISDELKIIGSPLETVETAIIMEHLKGLIDQYNVKEVVVGLPMGLDNKKTDATIPVETFIQKFQKRFENVKIHTMDERFTSKIAKQTMIQGNVPKMKRRDKGMVDKISAAIILQSFLDTGS